MPAVLAACATAGCYHPSPAQGLPCSEPDHTCPGDQVCDLAHVPPLCVDEVGDGSVDIPTDTPLACSTGCPQPTAPVCDTALGICRGCIADTECPGACHELAGMCTTEARERERLANQVRARTKELLETNQLLLKTQKELLAYKKGLTV